MGRQLRCALLASICLCGLLALADSAAVVSKRAVAETAEMSLGNTCFNSTPCGWLVYVPFTRRADYFMKNTCECPKGMSCLRTDDDLSVSAYVYRCRTESSTNDSS